MASNGVFLLGTCVICERSLIETCNRQRTSIRSWRLHLKYDSPSARLTRLHRVNMGTRRIRNQQPNLRLSRLLRRVLR